MNDEIARNPIKGWALYDDRCGFCRRWIPFWAAALRKRGFGVAPLPKRLVARSSRPLKNRTAWRLAIAPGRRATHSRGRCIQVFDATRLVGLAVISILDRARDEVALRLGV